ncbi:MAG: glutaredoxin domain-containing protein [Acidimicrobiales bacterium]
MTDVNPMKAITPVVLWRPHCPFCRILFSAIERHGLVVETRNIWEDEEARELLNLRIGSETVPSVLVGDEIMVNPSITELLATVRAASAK